MSEESTEKTVNRLADLWKKHPAVVGVFAVVVLLVVVGALIYIFAKGGKKKETKEK